MSDWNHVHRSIRPVTYPELGGVEVGWAMCRNRMCRNFGVFYGTQTDTDGNDTCYNLEKNKYDETVAITCRWCGLKSKLYAPDSLRPILRHFLSITLPFAACPNSACPNYGVNAFPSTTTGLQRDRQNPIAPCVPRNSAARIARRPPNEKAEICFTWELDGISIRRGRGNRSRDVLDNVWKGHGVTEAKKDEMSPATYYRKLYRVGDRLRDYNSYLNLDLLKPGSCGQEGSDAFVQTDVIKASLKRLGDQPARSQILNIIVSVLRMEKTFFVLAAHPYYLPKAKCPTFDELEADYENLAPLDRQWDGLHSLLDEVELVDPKTGAISHAVVDAGLPGLFMRTPYAEAAHFLIVRRLLSRFKRMIFYMDASYDLSLAVQIALREDIVSGRAHVALFQFSKNKKTRPSLPSRQEARKSASGRVRRHGRTFPRAGCPIALSFFQSRFRH